MRMGPFVVDLCNGKPIIVSWSFLSFKIYCIARWLNLNTSRHVAGGSRLSGIENFLRHRFSHTSSLYARTCNSLLVMARLQRSVASRCEAMWVRISIGKVNGDDVSL